MTSGAQRCGAAVLRLLLAALVACGPSYAREAAPGNDSLNCTRLTGPAGIEPARWSSVEDAAALTRPGGGRLKFNARDGRELALHFVRPRSFDPARGPIWFIMHGRARDAGRYATEAAPHAARYGALVIAVEFPREGYPRGDNYTLGVVTRGRADASAMGQGRWREPGHYLYNELERVFEAVRATTGSRQPGYYVFGHSAGAQFTHRLITFVPCARVLRAVAANAGWYTLPTREAPYPMPYSLGNTPLGVAQQRALLAAPLVVMLGAEDTREPEDDDGVRSTPAAMAQGRNRLDRGRHYFEAGRRLAQQLQAPFNWSLVVVPDASHRAGQMIGPAAQVLFARSPGPACERSGSPKASTCTTERSP